MQNTLDEVVMFWMGRDLTIIEIASLLSILRAGHQITVFSYEKLRQLPSGIRWSDASEILPKERFALYKGRNPALGANLFRYRLMAAGRGLWLDIDVLLLKPIHRTEGELYGWQDAHQINNAVLYLSANSPILKGLIDYTRSEFPIPPFYNKDMQNALMVSRLSGNPTHVSELPWGVWGPSALTYFVKKNGLEERAKPPEVFYPIPFSEAHMVITSGYDVEAKLTSSTLAIHLWNSMLKSPSRIRPNVSSGPVIVETGSFLETFCRENLGLRVSP